MSEPIHVITVETFAADDTEMKEALISVSGKIENTAICSLQNASRWVQETIITNKMRIIFPNRHKEKADDSAG